MTTVTPPFTGSYAAGLQGINVSRFELFGISVAPKMGRNGMSTFLSSSAQIINVSSDVTTFFDDSIRRPQPISSIAALSSSAVEVISDDDYRVQQIPRFRLSRQTFGIERITDGNVPFVEMNSFDPIVYITEPDQMAYPVVLDAPNELDPFDYSGAIEPFVLRKVIAGYSTFLGTFDDPDPTGIRGAVSSGVLQTNRNSKAIKADNFYSLLSQSADYYEEVGELPQFETFTVPGFSQYLPYESSAVSLIEPFRAQDPKEEIFYNVSNAEIRIALESSYTKLNSPTGYPASNFKSEPCGFVYENSRGIDSIAYGGLLK
jgi:hypothetical protein